MVCPHMSPQIKASLFLPGASTFPRLFVMYSFLAFFHIFCRVSWYPRSCWSTSGTHGVFCFGPCHAFFPCNISLCSNSFILYRCQMFSFPALDQYQSLQQVASALRCIVVWLVGGVGSLARHALVTNAGLTVVLNPPGCNSVFLWRATLIFPARIAHAAPQGVLVISPACHLTLVTNRSIVRFPPVI